MDVSTDAAGGHGDLGPRMRPILAFAVTAGLYAGIAALAFWNVTVPTLPLVVSAVLGALLMTLSLADRLDLDLPDVLPLVLAGCGLLATLVMVPEALFSRIVGALAGLVIMQALALAWRGAIGTGGPQRSDVWLLGAGGAWIGMEGLSTALLWTAAGLVLAASMALASGYRIERTVRIPVGPCLGLGIWLVWMFKPLVE